MKRWIWLASLKEAGLEGQNDSRRLLAFDVEDREAILLPRALARALFGAKQELASVSAMGAGAWQSPDESGGLITQLIHFKTKRALDEAGWSALMAALTRVSSAAALVELPPSFQEDFGRAYPVHSFGRLRDSEPISSSILYNAAATSLEASYLAREMRAPLAAARKPIFL